MVEKGSPGRRIAVVVVHGVGDNQPGSTVNAVVEGLAGQSSGTRNFAGPAAEGQTITASSAHGIWMLPEPASANPGSSAGRFPVYVREAGLAEGNSATFFELYWADLTRSGTSWWDTLKDTGRFIFELPHLADGFMAGAQDPASRLLRRLLLLAMCFVRGPIAGFTMVILVSALTFMTFNWIPDFESIVGVSEAVSAWLWLGAHHFLRAEDLAVLTSALPTIRLDLPPILAWLAAIASAFAMWRSRPRSGTRFLALYVFAIASFYVLDIHVMRPERYRSYAGFVYLDHLLVTMTGLAVAGLYLFLNHRRSIVGFSDFGLSMTVCAVAFLLSVGPLGDALRNYLGVSPMPIMATVTTASSTTHVWTLQFLYPLLALLWLPWAVAVAVSLVLLLLMSLVAFFSRRLVVRSAWAAVALATLQALIWLTASSAVAVAHLDDLLCRGSRSYATTRPPVTCQTKLYYNYQTVDLLLRLRHGDDATFKSLPPHLQTDVDRALRERMPHTLDFDTVKLLMELSESFLIGIMAFVVLGLVSAGVLVVRWLCVWVRAARPLARLRIPRLIINNAVLLTLVFLGALLSLPPSFGIFGTTGSILRDTAAAETGTVDIAVAITALAFVLAQIPNTPMTSVLQILRALIDHHYRPSVSVLNPGIGWLKWHTNATRAVTTERRAHIMGRLETLYQTCIRDQGFAEVVFLAHSQGTVILYDFLTARGPDIGSSFDVVTVGSPLGHLYRHYFREYGEIESRLRGLTPRLRSWTNLYRFDDAIAGPLLIRRHHDDDDALRPALDIQMARGGHLGYWREAIVCDRIRALLVLPPDARR